MINNDLRDDKICGKANFFCVNLLASRLTTHIQICKFTRYILIIYRSKALIFKPHLFLFYLKFLGCIYRQGYAYGEK